MERQLEVLRDILRNNATSAYGQAHGFAEIHQLEEFRRRVPITSYERLAPQVQRILSGEQNVLSTSPLYRLVSSSGSTEKPKFIPMTKAYCEDAYGPFLKQCLSALQNGGIRLQTDPQRMLNFRADPLRRRPVLDNGLEHLGLSQISFEDDFSDIPSEPGATAMSAQIPPSIECDLERMYYRLLLATQADIRYVIGINPAILSSTVRLLTERAADFIRDIALGTYDGAVVMPPNPDLADRLHDTLTRDRRILPRTIWPGIEALCCWNSGLAAFYLPRLASQYGEHTRILAAPLGASEAAIAVPVHDGDAGEPLAYDACFYEFIDLERATLATAWELEAGRVYSIVVTQQSGLYRYDLKDVVKVVGFLDGVPRLQYRGRHRDGDVLQEFEFLDLVEETMAECAIENIGTAASSDQIQIYIEFAAEEHPVRRHEAGLRLQAATVSRLMDRPIKDVQVFEAASGSFYSVWSARVRAGARAAQVKDQFRLDPQFIPLLKPVPLTSA